MCLSKLKVYLSAFLGEYVLPSVRFLLTVHEMWATDLDELDVFVDQYLKW